jgi:hypothetical protein
MERTSIKLAVYTALFTDHPDYLYGDLIPYNHDKDGIDYIAFTNSDYLKSDFWDVRKMDIWRNGRWTARKCKTIPNVILPEYDAWLWMDNEIFFTYDPHDLFAYYLEDYDLAVHKHCDRNCLYEEVIAASHRNPLRDPIDSILDQGRNYDTAGYPKNIGLYENGILFRRNNTKIKEFNDFWFQETANWNTEDQISMMYSLWKHPEVKVNPIHNTFVLHNYRNKHLPLTDKFGCVLRENRYVKS